MLWGQGRDLEHILIRKLSPSLTQTNTILICDGKGVGCDGSLVFIVGAPIEVAKGYLHGLNLSGKWGNLSAMWSR